jgi:hypothetical protein
MFEVKVLVEDRKLPKVLWVLDGEVVGEPVVRPVRGATVKNGKVSSTQPILGASQPVQIAHLLAKGRIESVTPKDLQNLLVEIGGKPGSYGNVLYHLLKAKALGPKRKDGAYPVIKARK